MKWQHASRFQSQFCHRHLCDFGHVTLPLWALVPHLYQEGGENELYNLFDCWTLVSTLLGTRPRGSPFGHSPGTVAQPMGSEVQLGTRWSQPP